MPRRKSADANGAPPAQDQSQIDDLAKQKKFQDTVKIVAAALAIIADERQGINDTLKDMREAGYTAKECKAIRTHAQLEVKDAHAAAREEIDALQRVGHAIGVNLFSAAGVDLPEQERAAA